MPSTSTSHSESLHGDLYDGVTAAAVAVTVTLGEDGLLCIRGESGERTAPFADCKISPALGRTARHLTLPDGTTIETRDFEVLAAWERQHQRGGGANFIHALESRWRYALLAAVILVLASVAAYIWGIPAAARLVAFRIPPSLNETLSRQTLSAIEKLLRLEPTKLPWERQEELRGKFAAAARDLGQSGFNYRLEFRSSSHKLPNAFALPSGIIVMTDDLVALAKRDEEILGILAHEITHVEQRHGVRSVLQNSGVFFLLGMLLGDLASITSLGAALPTVFAESGYSRAFEREADAGAAAYSVQRGWGTEPLGDILERLGKEHPDLKSLSWISSHPETDARVKALREFVNRKAPR